MHLSHIQLSIDFRYIHFKSIQLAHEMFFRFHLVIAFGHCFEVGVCRLSLAKSGIFFPHDHLSTALE